MFILTVCAEAYNPDEEEDDAEEVSQRQMIMRGLKHLVKLFGRTLKGSRERFDHIKNKKPT